MKNGIKLIKNRSDIGAGTRGADLGVDAIEIAAINVENDYFNRYNHVDVKTHNESIYNKVMNSFAKRIEFVAEQCSRVANTVSQTIQDGYYPIILSGDHSSSIGSISGFKSAYPNKKVGVIWVDAHADLHSPFTSPSGNIHGMPIAALTHLDNEEYKINQVLPSTQSFWDNLKNLGIDGAKLNPEDLIYYGVRSTEIPEDHLIRIHKIKNYTVSEVRFRGIEVCVAEAIDKLKVCDVVFISFDVDSMDCGLVSDGTGTPVNKGFDQQEVTEIITRHIQSNNVMAFEIVEVNPLLDTKGNKMAETAFEILDTVTSIINQKIKVFKD